MMFPMATNSVLSSAGKLLTTKSTLNVCNIERFLHRIAFRRFCVFDSATGNEAGNHVTRLARSDSVAVMTTTGTLVTYYYSSRTRIALFLNCALGLASP